MVSDLLELLDRMTAFLRDRREKEHLSFDRCIQPLFVEMQLIHDNYRTVLRDLQKQCAFAAPTETIITLLRENKFPLEPLRVKVRSFLDSIPNERAEGLEQEFYEVCRKYFHSHRRRDSTRFSELIDELSRGRAVSAEDAALRIQLSFDNIEFGWGQIAEAYAKLLRARIK